MFICIIKQHLSNIWSLIKHENFNQQWGWVENIHCLLKIMYIYIYIIILNIIIIYYVLHVLYVLYILYIHICYIYIIYIYTGDNTGI